MLDKAMQKKALLDQNNNTLELEDLALLESAEDLYPLAQEQNDILSLYKSDKTSKPQSNTQISSIIQLMSNSVIPFIILSPELSIIYYSQATEILFDSFYRLTQKPFFNIFLNALDQQEIQDLILALRSFERGYSWTGILKHKKQMAKTLLTRTKFVPFFDEKKGVAGFLVYFENITETHNTQLKKTYKSILDAAKLKDNDTGLHDERVSYYSKKMAEYLFTIQKYPQIDLDFIEDISFLSALHDVGKIGTPDYILLKPGKLDEKEWVIMREHTINGTFILSSYPSPMAKEITLSHHEWWNGTGYPFKLEGEMIPLSARIVTIADVYDALRMKRTYKPEFTHQESVDIIVTGSGTQFDPELIKVFLRIHQDFDDIWTLLKDTQPEQISVRETKY